MTGQHLMTIRTVLICLGLLSAYRGHSHTGPPFPILSDQDIPGHKVAIWADPDIGESLFYVVLEPRGTGHIPEISGVELWVQPTNGRLPKVVYQTTVTEARQHMRFTANPHLDAQEMWTVGIDIHLADGSHYPMTAEVEATPPGLRPVDVVIYLIPFVFFGGLWGIAFVRKLRRRPTVEHASRPQRPDAIAT